MIKENALIVLEFNSLPAESYKNETIRLLLSHITAYGLVGFQGYTNILHNYTRKKRILAEIQESRIE